MTRYLLLIILLLPGLCDSAAAAQPAAADIESQLAEAERLHTVAQAGHHGWIPTSRLITEARSTLAQGELAAAAEIAARALTAARASVAQMQREQADWSARVPGS